MEVVRISYPLQNEMIDSGSNSGQSIAIGDFDGVHLGHRKVIGEAVEAAKAEGLSSAVMTFHPHPREVLGSSIYASYLTPLDRKLKQFEQLGADRVYVVHFDHEFAKLSPAGFVNEVLKPLRMQRAVVGFNFTFGHRGAGTSETLKELAGDSYRVSVVQPYQMDGEQVSSTRIREALSAGDANLAAQLLGRRYEVGGTVIRGEGRGRTIGIPTANVKPDGAYVVPAAGVYAVSVILDGGEKLRGVMNIGKKPTFHADLPEPTWEVHLFDFDRDIYARSLTVQFHSRIRSERKFESADALVRQIEEDIRHAKQLLFPVV